MFDTEVIGHLIRFVNQIIVATDTEMKIIPRNTPRGRPRSFDREAALAAAMTVFWKKGYTAASISDLCQAMGIASPSLYAAFSSKENLYAEAIAHYGAMASPKIWNPLESACTAREGVAAFLRASAENLVKPGLPRGCMVTLSDAAGADVPEICKLLNGERAKILKTLQTRLQRGIVEGDLPAHFDTKSTARFYLTIQQGMSIQARDGATRKELEAVADFAMAAWPED
jgi:AcrR family transcriptional regulator